MSDALSSYSALATSAKGFCFMAIPETIEIFLTIFTLL